MSKQNRKRGEAGQRADLYPPARDQTYPSDRYQHDDDRPQHQPTPSGEADEEQASGA